MGRTIEISGGVNSIEGDVEILEVHGGAINVFGRVGAVNQFGGVLNGKTAIAPQPEPNVIYRDRVVYRDRPVEKIVYRDKPDDFWFGRYAQLTTELEAERKAHRQEVAELKERLEGALEAYHNLLHPQQPQKPKPYRTWDDYRPTKQECEAVYKNLKIWLECEDNNTLNL